LEQQMPRLASDDARLLFSQARVARLATVTGAGAPHLVPVTFVVSADLIFTAVDAKPKSTTALRRLDNIRRDPRVALLADHYADDWAGLWWVRADGTAVVLDSPADQAQPIDMLAARYPQYRQVRPVGPVIRIQVTRWSGWSAS
jgi:PPOX class probable F420-dependent enzyme